MTYKTLIVDDEQAARQEVRKALKPHSPSMQIIAEAADGAEALELINEMKPDVVFFDIELPEMDAFEVISRLRHHPVIIFTTGHNKYALEAFNTPELAIEYLLKPIKQKEIDRAVSKLGSLLKSAESQQDALLNFLKEKLDKDYITRFHCKVGDSINIVRVEDVKFIQANERYSDIHTADGKCYAESLTIAALEERLDPGQFIRVHRGTIVNDAFIAKINKGLFGKLELEIKGEPRPIDVSKSYAYKFK